MLMEFINALPKIWLEVVALFSLSVLIISVILLQTNYTSVIPTLGLFAGAAFIILPSINRAVGSIQRFKYYSPVINELHTQLENMKRNSKQIEDKKINWSNRAGYVPQNVFLINSSIKENVAFGIPKEEIDETRVIKSINLSQLDKFIDSLPDGLNTIIGERGSKLSGGQIQRIGSKSFI